MNREKFSLTIIYENILHKCWKLRTSLENVTIDCTNESIKLAVLGFHRKKSEFNALDFQVRLA